MAELSASKSEAPSPSWTIASPSIIADWQGRLAAARTIDGYRIEESREDEEASEQFPPSEASSFPRRPRTNRSAKIALALSPKKGSKRFNLVRLSTRTT